MALVLILRLSLSKKSTGPNHLLTQGMVWYDSVNSGNANYDFLGYNRFLNEELENFSY